MAVNSPVFNIIPNGIMDNDTLSKYIAPGNYIDLLNARNTINSSGNFESIEDDSGNILIPNLDLGPGRNKCIGSLQDTAGNSIFYMVWNSNGYHAIFRMYFRNTPGSPDGDIETVWKVRYPNLYNGVNSFNPLNFDEHHLITGIDLVENLLCWTDFYGELKCVNVVRANNTKKRFQFECYINPLDIKLGVATYTINLYKAGTSAPVYVLTVNSSAPTIAERIKDIIAASKFDPLFATYLNVENKGQYALFTCVSTGEYFMNIKSTNQHQSIILPGNHYADFVQGCAESFPPLTADVFLRIKYPPFCPPRADFDTDSTFFPGNNFAIGNSNWILSNIGPPNSFFVYTANTPLEIRLNVQFTVNVWLSGTSTMSFVLSDGTILYSHQNAADSVGTFNLTFTLNPYTNFIAFDLAIGVLGNFCQIDVTGGFLEIYNLATSSYECYVNVTVSPQIQFLGLPLIYYFGFDLGTQVNAAKTEISNRNLLFCTKYYFVDNEQSVYGARSKMPLAKSIFNKWINIDFDDKWLNDLNYLSQIKKVRIAVSEDNGTTWGDVVEFERQDFAPFGPCRQFKYFGNELFLAVAESAALLPFHPIPLLAGSQAYIGNRLWNGMILEGYDSILIDASVTVKYRDYLNTTVYNYEPYISTRGFRYGYKGYVGIVYYDNGDRRSGVNILSPTPIEIPFLYQDPNFTNLQTQAFVPYLEVAINNPPPKWAKKWKLVITRDITVNNYLQFFPAQVNKVDENFVESSANPVYWEIDMATITYYVTKANLGSEINYTFEKGDRIRILAQLDGTIIKQEFDFEILEITSDKIYIEYQTGTPFEINVAESDGNNCWIEIYSPKNQADEGNQTFFETGDCYEVITGIQNNLYVQYHQGTTDQQFGGTPLNINTPAIITTDYGGAYYRKRNQYYYIQPATTFQGVNAGWICSNAPNEYRAETYDGFGRSNFVQEIGQVFRFSALKFSDTFISGTETNRLNVIQPANDRQYDVVFGALRKMVVLDNDNLRLIFANVQLTIYVNQGVIQQAQGGNPLISVFNDVAPDSHIIQRTTGTQNPESVVVNDEGDMIGWDETEGLVYRSSSNGLIPISDIKQKNRFDQASKLRRFLDRKISECPAVYDLYHDEYIITLGALEPVKEKMPRAVIAMFGASSAYIGIRVEIQPSNRFIGYSPFIGPNINQALTNIFQLVGFTINTLPDFSLEIIANDSSYSNENIVIEVIFQQDPESVVERKYYSFAFDEYIPPGTQTPFPAVTLSFTKAKPGWTHRYSFTPEYYGQLRNEYVSFVNGQLWLHNRGVSKNYYGVQYPMEMVLPCNPYPSVNKMFKGLMLNCSGKYAVPELKIEPYEGIPTGMESELTIAHFTTKDGKQYAAIQRDKLTPNKTIAEGWINGRPMVGQVMTIKLVNN